MQTSDSDVVMYFIYRGSDPIAGESTAELARDDKLTADFKAGRYFDAEDFVFSMNLEDDEGRQGKVEADGARSYARWRALKNDDVKPNPPFRAEPDEFNLTRLIDMSSPVLLQHCLDAHRLDRAVLVKRSRSSTGTLTGYLRMEFESVWIKSITWQDYAAVREQCRFRYASLNVTYIKRKPDGSAASTWPSRWQGLSDG